jgi:hypothetical protein
MTDRFVALPAQESVVAKLSALVPANPFSTPAYFEARRRAGWAAWVLVQGDSSSDFERGCGAFITKRGWFRKLEVPSLPAVPVDSPLWEDLRDFCRSHGVTKLELSTFGSPVGVEIPLSFTCAHRMRCEFILDLGSDLYARLDKSHRANVKRAQRAGLAVRRTRSIEALAAHQAMIGHSMDRRRARGEQVPSVGSSLDAATLLEAGAGELYQALSGEAVLSSGLVLRAPKGAYGHSTGTSPEGMTVGASHFLMHCIAKQLSAEGVPTLNFGAADEESGLAHFKRGFGTSQVRLPSAICYVGPLWRRRAYRTLELARTEQKTLLRSLKGRDVR